MRLSLTLAAAAVLAAAALSGATHAGERSNVAQFVNPPNPYVIGSGVNLELQMLAGAPSNPNVVFQVWSNVAGAIQAPYTDYDPPFIYPASYLNQVTPGSAEIQAIVRNSSFQIVEIIRFVTNFTQASTPTPGGSAVIQTIADSGMAPFTVHVHALNSTLNVGNQNTARYEWNFGNPGAAYNTLNGWSAAHTYNQPGTYTVTLKVTNQSGGVATATRQITVNPPSRSFIYVSPTGNDANSGTSEASPVQTFARAAQLVAHNRAILFRRNATYNTTATMVINHQNVLVGAYGSGSTPVINFTSNTNYAKMIDFGTSARDAIIENLSFSSSFTPNNMIVRAIQPHGTNVTIRNCTFGNISYAINCGGSNGVTGLLAQNNNASMLGAYFSWAEGSDHVYLGNTVGGSVDEHNIRFGGVTRSLIAHNHLTNQLKATIWTMLGEHCYIANNTINTGRVITGPNFATSSPGERFRWLVFENNRMTDHGVVIYSGSENMVFRNNIFTYHGGECFNLAGYNSNWNRTVKNITIVNNTGLNNSNQWGKFFKTWAGSENITLANNLYWAPNLNSTWGATNAYFGDATLNTQTSRNNLWAVQATGSHVHFVGEVGRTQSQWASYSQTTSEQYRVFSNACLNNQQVPQFNASLAAPAVGVFTDIHGNLRPNGGSPWAVGAVETNPGSPVGNPDINGDGVVNVIDLLIVLNAWGTCPVPSNCPADINGDGLVNVTDLLLVINAWSAGP